MVKRCQWGLCKSDSRYPERLGDGIKFIPFPKPKRNLEKCKRWIRACGRPHTQLNTSVVDGNYNMYVCSKHFTDGGPNEKYPDPIPASSADLIKLTPVRPPPKRRHLSEPAVSKSRRILQELPTENVRNEQPDVVQTDDENVPQSELCTNTNASLTDTTQNHMSSIDVLALAAENRLLQQQLGKQILDNEALRRENLCLEEKMKSNNNHSLKKANQFTVETVRDSPIKDNFKYYTGFLFVQFMAIFKFLVPNKYECPINFPRTITSIKRIKLEDQLLLTIVKLRLNLDFKHIANLFKISNQDAGALFRTWINYMFYRFGSVPIWPHRDILISKMPKSFHKDFPNTMVILDGTEIKMERPSGLRSQSQCYSDYKSACTLKGLVGIDPRGSFTFISMLFSGSISDKEITRRSGLLDLLQQLLDWQIGKRRQCHG